MSRIGNQPIALPAGVEVTRNNGSVVVKGPKGTLERPVPEGIELRVEGSQLIHGMNVLSPGASVLTLQPPDRFVCFYKYLTDRDQQHFGFVVGIPDGSGFRIDLDELERTFLKGPIDGHDAQRVVIAVE